jgi:phosphonatase-like hydrolase
MYPYLAVFDIAGTTVNDQGAVQRALIEVFKGASGLDLPMAEANALMGIPKPIAFEQLCHRYMGKTDPELTKSLTERFEEQLLAVYSDASQIEPMPFAIERFTELRRNGCKVFLDTGFSRRITDQILQTLHWATLIDGSICSDEVKNGRPHPDMIYKAMEESGVKSNFMVAKIGDTISDLVEGHTAGCGWVIGVCTGANQKQELRKFPHTQILDDLSGLSRIFK